MNSFTNKNEKQVHFNQVKGTIQELNDGEKYCSITLVAGHENKREINLSLRKNDFDEVVKTYKIGDKVAVRYFLSSHKKNERWYTTANVLDVHKDF